MYGEEAADDDAGSRSGVCSAAAAGDRKATHAERCVFLTDVAESGGAAAGRDGGAIHSLSFSRSLAFSRSLSRFLAISLSRSLSLHSSAAVA